jgi:O-antigen ligase
LLFGTLANPNLLGLHLLFGLPFCLLPVFRHGLWSFRGALAGSLALLTVLTTIRTGSRQALISMLGMVLFGFWHASLTGKLKLVVATALMAVVGVAITPQGALERYATLVSSEASASAIADSAVESTASRMYHFRQSLELTVRNPLFGVGPGEFMVAAADLSKDVGERAAWMQTHNSLTQISSEGGIPALLFYSLFIFFCIKPLASLYRSTRNSPQFRDLAHVAFCLLLAYTSTIINSLFVSIAYQVYFPALGALTLAFLHAARGYLASVPAQPVQTPNTGMPRPPAYPAAYPAAYTPAGPSAPPRGRRSRAGL